MRRARTPVLCRTHSTPYSTVLAVPLTPQYSRSPSEPTVPLSPLYSPHPVLLCTHRTPYSSVLAVNPYFPVLTVPISTPYVRVLTVPLTSQCSQDKRRLRRAVVCLCAAAAGRGTVSTNGDCEHYWGLSVLIGTVSVLLCVCVCVRASAAAAGRGRRRHSRKAKVSRCRAKWDVTLSGVNAKWDATLSGTPC